MERRIGKIDTYLESVHQDLQNGTHFSSFLKIRLNSLLQETYVKTEFRLTSLLISFFVNSISCAVCLGKVYYNSIAFKAS